MKRFRAGSAIILAFLCASAVLSAQDGSASGDAQATAAPLAVDWRPTDLLLRDTVQVILNLDSARRLSSAPSPIINMLGAGTVFPLADQFSIAPTLDFYSCYYNWVSGRAVVAMDESRTAVVLGAILDLPINYTIDFTPIHRLILSGGPAFVIRAGVLGQAVPSAEQPAVNSISAYLWDKGRFFYPEVGISYSYAAASWVRFGATARVMFPLFNWWTGEGLPFADNMIVGGGIWLSFNDFWRNLKPLGWFKKKEKAAPLSPVEGDGEASSP
jgi:hypothetical protein